MASIEERISENGKKSFRVKIRLKGNPTQSATFERLTDARKWVQDTESAIREGRHFKTTEAKRHTLAETIDRYIRDVLPQKPKSLRDQKTQLLWWKSKIGSYLLSDSTPGLIGEQRDKLANENVSSQKGIEKKRSPATVNRYLAALSHVFTIASKEWEWVEDSPLRKVKKRQEPRGRVRFLSDEERTKLLDACKESQNSYLYTVVVLALSTGARKMEILSLQWKNVDLQRNVIILEETKNGDRRVLPLSGLALELIKKHSKVRKINTDLLFSGQKPQKPIEIKKSWEAALKKAGILDFRFHDLRHSCASYLAMNGASAGEIAEVLGHRTLQMVKRYSHFSQSHTAGVLANMNSKIFG